MGDQKQKIKEMQHKKKKRRKEAAAGIGLIILGAVIAFGMTQTGILNDISNDEEKIEYDAEVTIATGIRPYRTSIVSNETIKFKNTRSSPVNITFETNDIEEHVYIEANQSGYFDASEYENLPYRNYYNLDSGDTGEIVIQ